MAAQVAALAFSFLAPTNEDLKQMADRPVTNYDRLNQQRQLLQKPVIGSNQIAVVITIIACCCIACSFMMSILLIM